MSFALLMIIIMIACYALHYVVAAVYFIVILFMARKPSTKSLAASTIHTTAKDRAKAFPRIANSCEDNNIGHGTKHGNLVAQSSKEAEQYVQQQLNDMHEATLAAT